MLLGPVFAAELLAAGRKRRYYLVRVLIAGILLAILGMVYSGWRVRAGQGLSIRESAMVAGSFFQGLSWFLMWVTVLLAPGVAAGAIATERERRTIEYLFATDITNREIVVGKVAVRVLLMVSLLAVGLPVVAIFRLLGGISGDLLLGLYALLTSSTLLLVSLGVCVSVYTNRARDALARTYLLVVVLFAAYPLITITLGRSLGIASSPWLQQTESVLNAVNPFLALATALGGRTATAGAGILWTELLTAIGSQVALSVVLVTFATFAVRRVHLRSMGSASRLPSGPMAAVRPSRSIGDRPLLWKELHSRSAGIRWGFVGRILLALLVLGAITSSVLSFYLAQTRTWGTAGAQFAPTTVVVTVATGMALVLLAALRAAGMVTGERERDTWTTLLSTPVRGDELMGAKFYGTLHSLRWLALPLPVVWTLQCILSPSYAVGIGMSMAVILATTSAATAIGLNFSLQFQSTLKAAGATLGVLVMAGGGYLMCCCPIFFSGMGDEWVVVFLAPCIPYLLGVPITFAFDYRDVDQMGLVIFTLFVGIGGYAIAAASLMHFVREGFDRLAPRMASNRWATPGTTGHESPAAQQPSPT